MRVLWVFAHPEPESLNGMLRDEGIRTLHEQGHEVDESDLYAMGWKPVVDRDDFPDPTETDAPLVVTAESRRAFCDGTLAADIRAEQDKLDRADAVVLQFPLWWAGPPAILKGWIDRVFVKGFAYGVHDPRDPRRTLRYGDGRLSGTRALVITTVGSPEPAMGPRGVNGELEQLLFGLLHGTLWYTGMSVLPPLAVHGADRADAADHAEALARVRAAVRAIGGTPPLSYRRQNGGDYDDDLVLRPHLAPGRSGLEVHLAGPAGA